MPSVKLRQYYINNFDSKSQETKFDILRKQNITVNDLQDDRGGKIEPIYKTEQDHVETQPGVLNNPPFVDDGSYTMNGYNAGSDQTNTETDQKIR